MHHHIKLFSLVRRTLSIIGYITLFRFNYCWKFCSSLDILCIGNFFHSDALYVVVIHTYIGTLPDIRNFHTVPTYFRMLTAIRHLHADFLHCYWFESQFPIWLTFSYSIWLVLINSIQLLLQKGSFKFESQLSHTPGIPISTRV